MEIRFGIDFDDVDEVSDRLIDLSVLFSIKTDDPMKRTSIVTVHVDTYKELVKAFYVCIMFAMLRDE